MDKYQQAQHDWEQLMWRIGRDEKDYFEIDNEFYLETLIRMSSRRGVMCWVYSDLCFAKKITRIEQLDKEIKDRMWRNVKSMCEGRELDKKALIQICKAFYVIEYFLNEKVC